MKPYGRKNIADDQSIFLSPVPSRKRRVTQNLFGTGVNKFKVFSVKKNLNESNISTVILASVLLHIMLREKLVDT